jgi:hypothetical protein
MGTVHEYVITLPALDIRYLHIGNKYALMQIGMYETSLTRGEAAKFLKNCRRFGYKIERVN